MRFNLNRETLDNVVHGHSLKYYASFGVAMALSYGAGFYATMYTHAHDFSDFGIAATTAITKGLVFTVVNSLLYLRLHRNDPDLPHKKNSTIGTNAIILGIDALGKPGSHFALMKCDVDPRAAMIISYSILGIYLGYLKITRDYRNDLIFPSHKPHAGIKL